MKQTDKEEKSTPMLDSRTDLSKLMEQLKQIGSKHVPHPGGVKIRIYPQLKK
jgi:hypothetical protein